MEAVKEANLAQALTPTINMLALDVQASEAEKEGHTFDEPILIEGRKDRLYVRGQLREYFVGLKHGYKSLPEEYVRA